MVTSHRPPLRAHQSTLATLIAAMARGEASEVTDILAAVTPGGGKSLLPVIAAAHLIKAGQVERICWVVPRDSLRLQAEEAFADRAWRTVLGHALSVRVAGNEPDPSRGLAGYVTTYQAIAAAPELHLAEFRRHRTLLVVDEVHHLPTLGEYEPTAHLSSGQAPASSEDTSAWSRALLPLLESAALRLLLSGPWNGRMADASCGCPTARVLRPIPRRIPHARQLSLLFPLGQSRLSRPSLRGTAAA
jgi:hypothetical protein